MTQVLSSSDRVAMASVCGLEQVDDNLYRSTATYRIDGGPRHGGRGNPLFGGQVAAQALLACGATVVDRLPHSLHGYFLRPGRTDQPIDYVVHRDRDGRSYSSRRVEAVQDGKTIFSMAASFCVRREESVESQPTSGFPDVPDPFDCEPVDVEPELALEIRVCSRPSRQQYFPTLFWARPHQLEGMNRLDHAAALTYMSDFSSGLPREHGQWTLGPSVDHALWLHRPFIWTDWVLVELTPGVAGNGRGHYNGAIRDRAGVPIASFSQEMVYSQAR